MQELQPLLSIQRSRRNAELAEVVQEVVLDMLQPRFCLLHIVRLDPERKVFRLRQAVVALGELHPEHLAVFAADRVETVFFGRDPYALFKALRICGHIHEGQFEVDGAVEEVEERAPFLEYCRLVLLLRQLVVDILELDRPGVIIVPHAAYPVREHPLEGDGLLCSPGHPVIPPCLFDDLSYLLLLLF